MAVAYSPLCDTDLSAYLAYCFSNGAGSVTFNKCDGHRSGEECGGGGNDHGGSAVDFFSRVISSWKEDVGRICGSGDSVGNVGVGSVGLCPAVNGLVGAASGSALVDSGNADCCDSVVVERSSQSPDTHGFEASEVRLEGVVPRESVVSGRGPNWERNNQNRLKQKRRRLRRRMDVDWRRSGDQSDLPSVKEVVHVKKGFFSECDETVQVKLRESRAALLIAENERKVAEEKHKLSRITSTQSLIAEMVHVTAMANKLKRQTKDQAIGGWAETVAESLTKSIAENAPSSVPSLESVGYGKSALKSSSGSEVSSQKSLRQIEYEMMLKHVNDKFDNMDIICGDEQEVAIQEVKDFYADVAYTSEELIVKKKIAEFSDCLLLNGVSPERVDMAMEMFEKK